MCPFFDCLLWTAAADWKMQLSEWRQMRLLSGIVWARGGASTSCYSQEDLHWTGVTLEQRCLRREKIVVVFDLCIKWLCVCIIALLYRCFFLLLTYHYVDATVLCDLLYTSSVHSKVSHCSRSEYRLVPEELALLLAILQPETQLHTFPQLTPLDQNCFSLLLVALPLYWFLLHHLFRANNDLNFSQAKTANADAKNPTQYLTINSWWQ